MAGFVGLAIAAFSRIGGPPGGGLCMSAVSVCVRLRSQLNAKSGQHLQNCPERWIHVAAERSVKARAIYVRLFGNGPHSVGAREIAKRSDKSRIIGRERVIEVICNRLRIAAVFESSSFRHLVIPQLFPIAFDLRRSPPFVSLQFPFSPVRVFARRIRQAPSRAKDSGLT
jgi:hypothetical protein